MIGPSSSHTAGAVKIGRIAACIAGSNFDSVKFYLHGSFAKTYKGHGTDKALIAGIMGMTPNDKRIKEAFTIAKEKNIDFSFVETNLGRVHPNSVKIVFYGDNKEVNVTGSSIGGGNIIIIDIDGHKVNFTGEFPSIFIRHKDIKGVISKVALIFSVHDINIANMSVTRKQKGTEASTIIETDSIIPDEYSKELLKVNDIKEVRIINPVKESDIFV
jgi:L-serine dehydratase